MEAPGAKHQGDGGFFLRKGMLKKDELLLFLKGLCPGNAPLKHVSWRGYTGGVGVWNRKHLRLGVRSWM